MLIIFTFTLFYYCISCIFAINLIELEPVTKSLETTNPVDQGGMIQIHNIFKISKVTLNDFGFKL